jgi:hypothetical protein
MMGLIDIGNCASDSWAFEDGNFPRVPRVLNFAENKVVIEGIYLYTVDQPEIKFKITHFSRWYDEKEGYIEYLSIEELKDIKGIKYCYDYMN